MGLFDEIRRGTYVADDELPPVRWVGCQMSLADAAVRITSGEPALPVVRDFLDQVDRVDDVELARLIAERPRPTTTEADALLAGLAEHLAATRHLPCPRWVTEPERFLDRFWFVSDVPGFRAVAIAQTPVAFKRRGVFWPARSLRRV